MSSANKLFPSTPFCWLTFLFLLIIGNHDVSGTSTCPYRLLQSAFKVQVDLEDNTPDAGGIQQVVCSTDEKSSLAELIEKGIQKASKKVAESSKRFSFNESGASICKVPEEEETRRLSNQLPMSVRNLESHHRFRYYGAMRCNYCSKDNADPGKRMPTITKKPFILDCSLKWKPVPMKAPPIEDKTKLNHVSAPKSADAVKLELVLHPLGMWNGEHIFVSMNEFNIDLGGFYTTANDVARSSADLEKKPAILWAVEPASTTHPSSQLLKVTLQVPKIPLVLGNHQLNVEVFFGGNKDESETKRGRIEQLSAHYAKDRCYIQSMFRKPVRRLVSTPISNPVSSPVSSPTISGPITSPASSPVIAPKIHMGARTERRRGKNKREIKNIISSDKRDMINEGGEVSLSNMKASNPLKKAVEKKDPQVHKTIVPKQGSSNMIAPGASANQKNFKDANKRPRPPIIVLSLSRQSSFRNHTQNILTSVLDNDLKVVTSKPGHCMYGKEIKAVVHLAPKPEWEKNLPTCKQKQANS